MDVAVTFENVAAGGYTTATFDPDPPVLPTGLLAEGAVYEIHTTAELGGVITVRLLYDPAKVLDPSLLRIIHYEDGQWTDVTTGMGTEDHVVHGTVTSLSPFALSRPTPEPLCPVLASGWHLVAGSAGSSTEGNALFEYASGAYRSTTADVLEAGHGYWVKYPAAGTATLSMIYAPITARLVSGWNLIGNPTGVSLSLPAGLTGFVYDGAGYRSTTTLEPGEGAWVKATGGQDILLTPSG